MQTEAVATGGGGGAYLRKHHTKNVKSIGISQLTADAQECVIGSL